jgi:hypothetical protein
MLETEPEIDALQHLLDATLARANAHMRSIVTPERRLTARQVVAYLTGTRHIAFATTNRRGEPRVSPLDAVFIHGRFYAGTGAGAARVAHLRANPACSAVHMDGDRVGVTVNGRAEWIDRGHPGHGELVRVWIDTYGSDPYLLGDVVFFRIEPTSMWSFASNPADFPS